MSPSAARNGLQASVRRAYAIGGRNAGSRLTRSGARPVCEVGAGPNATKLLNASEALIDSGEPCTARHAHLPPHGVGHCPGRQSPSSQHAAVGRCATRGVAALADAAGVDFAHVGATSDFDTRAWAGRASIHPLAPASEMTSHSNVAVARRLNAVDLDCRRCTGWRDGDDGPNGRAGRTAYATGDDAAAQQKRRPYREFDTVAV